MSIKILIRLVQEHLSPAIKTALEKSGNQDSAFKTSLKSIQIVIDNFEKIYTSESRISLDNAFCLNAIRTNLPTCPLPNTINKKAEFDFYEQYAGFLTLIRDHEQFPFFEQNDSTAETMITSVLKCEKQELHAKLKNKIETTIKAANRIISEHEEQYASYEEVSTMVTKDTNNGSNASSSSSSSHTTTQHNNNVPTSLNPWEIIKAFQRIGYTPAKNDNQRALMPATLTDLFNHTYENIEIPIPIIIQKNNNEDEDEDFKGHLTLYFKNNKILASPVYANPQGNEISLGDALTQILTFIEMQQGTPPTDIIIPVVEAKSGTFGNAIRTIGKAAGYDADNEHIKTLHIKNIKFGTDKKIASYEVEYRDSKSNTLGNPYPSNHAQKAVLQSLKINWSGEWQDIPNDDKNQPLQNSSDCGYWAYLRCCTLFNGQDINSETEYLTENQMKLLFINLHLNDKKILVSEDGNFKNLLDAMESLYKGILHNIANDNVKKAINTLYKITLLIKDNTGSNTEYDVDDEDEDEDLNDFSVVKEVEKEKSIITNTNPYAKYLAKINGWRLSFPEPFINLHESFGIMPPVAPSASSSSSAASDATENNNSDAEITFHNPLDIIEKYKNSPFDYAREDADRALEPDTLSILFTHAYALNSAVQKESIDIDIEGSKQTVQLFHNGANVLCPPVYIDPEKNQIGLILAAARKLLNEKNLYPTAITIPIFEESKRTSGGHTQITYRIKILHIKEIQYDGKKITTYIADYYDSKREYLKSHRSDTFRKAVSAALDTDAKGSWTDITNQSNERFQPHLNASDDGYWTFLWCYQLFDKGKIDFFNQDYLTEHQMKLLFINFNLNNYKRVKNNNGNYQSLIDKMEILYLEILSENKVYIPALEILYDITKQIKKYQKQQNNKDQDSFYQKQKERIDAFYAISKSQNSIATTPPLLHNSNDDDEIYEYDDDLKRYSSVKIFLSGFQSEEQYSFLTEGGNVSASTDNSQTTLNGHRNSTGLSNSRPNTTAIGNSNDDLNPLTSLPSFHAERYEDKLFVNQSSSFTAPQWAITVKNFCYKNRRSIAGALLFLFGLYVITLTLVSAFTGGATLPLLGYTLAVADKFVAPLWAVATVSTVAGLGGGGSMLGGWFLHKSNPSINGDSGDAPAATPVLSNK